MDEIRILIADDDHIDRQGLRNLLQEEEHLKVVGEAADHGEAISQTHSLQPDLVLMDIHLSGPGAIEVIRQISKLHPAVKIMVLTAHQSDRFFFEILSAGASGYLVKGGSAAELVSAIRVVSRGDVFLSPSVAKLLINEYSKGAQTGHRGTVIA